MSQTAGEYLCYILRSTVIAPPRGRTYVGITNNMTNRLRKHNGEISGGARATRGHRPWEVVCRVEGFPDKRTAMQFEWRMHRRNTLRPRPDDPVQARLRFLQFVLRLEQWTSKSPAAQSVPLHLVWEREDLRPEGFTLPEHIAESAASSSAKVTQE